MPNSTRRHRVIEHAFANGMYGSMNRSLTDAKAHINGARRYADTYHCYDFTARDGSRLHVAYAHYKGGSPKHGYSKFTDADVTCLYEITDEALKASRGHATPLRIHRGR